MEVASEEIKRAMDLLEDCAMTIYRAHGRNAAIHTLSQIALNIEEMHNASIDPKVMVLIQEAISQASSATIH